MKKRILFLIAFIIMINGCSLTRQLSSDSKCKANVEFECNCDDKNDNAAIKIINKGL